jgi:hypothetical protein
LQEIKKDAKVKHQETQAEEEQATISLCWAANPKTFPRRKW